MVSRPGQGHASSAHAGRRAGRFFGLKGKSGHGNIARGDDRGQFLVVSGVLLVLGMMVFASTLITLNANQETGARDQRDLMVAQVDEIVATLDGALLNTVRPGEMNTTDFRSIAQVTQTQVQENAIRSGLFASITLVEDLTELDLALVQQEHRCLGVDVDASMDAGGAILGWDLDTLERGIVGAVYEIYVTDGTKSLRIDHYAKLRDCVSEDLQTHPVRWSGPLGVVKNLSASLVDDDEQMNVTEELDWENLVEMEVHPQINQSSIEVEGWNNPTNLLNLDGTYTDMPSRSSSLPDNNWFRFRLEPPERMRPGDSMPNITLEVTGFRDLEWNPDKPQEMYLRVYGNDTWEDPLIDEEVNLTVGVSETEELVLQEFVEGNDNWTYEEIVDSHWELAVRGTHHPSQKWNVDHFNMTGSMMMAQAYRANVTYDWPEIPSIYGDHTLHLRYRIDPATENEGFLLQMRDRDAFVGGGEWMTVHNMTDTTGEPDGWRTVETQTTEDGSESLPDRMEWRLWDTDHYDNWEPEDEDTVQIELFRVESTLQS